jgi:alanyl-tRNA synthetase
MIMETGLLYLDNTYLFESSGKILRCEEDTDGYKVLVLDQTNFYPQGGGQPFDTGIIQCGNATFRVKSVRFSGGEVIHRGQVIL